MVCNLYSVWSNCATKLHRLQVRAANSLLSIIHSMKLLLLLSDEAQIVSRRDAELASTSQEKEELKKKVTEMLNDLLRQPITGDSATQAE